MMLVPAAVLQADMFPQDVLCLCQSTCHICHLYGQLVAMTWSFPTAVGDTKALLMRIDSRQSRKILSLLRNLQNSKYFEKRATDRNLFQTCILSQMPTLALNRCWNPPIL